MTDTDRIKEVLRDYFDASFEADGRKIAGTFHDVAHLYSLNEDGSLLNWDKETFVKIVNSSKGEYPPYNEILSIDFTGENTAVARVKIRVGDTIYTDILSFLRLNGEWKIIAKVFTGAAAD